MGISNTLLRAVTWWNSQTLGTQLWTWRKGVRVGEDADGNVFYKNRDDSRRWVIFNGEAEASRISPVRGTTTPQNLGKAASREPDRHGLGLRARRLDPAQNARREV